MSGIPGSHNNEDFENMFQDVLKKAILVWDLDSTLVGNYFDMVTQFDEPRINTNALKIMNTAFKSPNFSANMMLTNNGNLRFIYHVISAMTQKYNEMFPDEKVPFLFSVIYTAAMNPDGTYKDLRVRDDTIPQSKNDSRYAAKRLEDVKNMCLEGRIPARNLAGNVFFFDDMPTHIIRGEITRGHYIQIQPPFNTVEGDGTNYGPVLEFLRDDNSNSVRGGGSTPVIMRKQSGGRKTRRKNRNERRK
jgi:hypothetical protein